MFKEKTPALDIHFFCASRFLWNFLLFNVPINVMLHLPVLEGKERKGVWELPTLPVAKVQPLESQHYVKS